MNRFKILLAINVFSSLGLFALNDVTILRDVSENDSISIVKQQYDINIYPCITSSWETYYEINNCSSEPYLLWISRDKNIKADRIVPNYFLGPISQNFNHCLIELFDKINIFVEYFRPTICRTFVKYLEPHSSFYIIDTSTKQNTIPGLTERITLVKKSAVDLIVLRNMEKYKDEFFFNPNILIIRGCN